MDQLNVFTYWGQGYNNMSPMIKKIYEHNLQFCNNINVKFILIDDINVYDYFEPHKRYKSLAYNFKSDIIRYNVLNKYGGFWFDTDVIIIKNLINLFDHFIAQNNKDMILDIECNSDSDGTLSVDGVKLGCASIATKKNSVCSNFCVEYVNNFLDKNTNLSWNDIGPTTVTELYLKHIDRLIINKYEVVNNGCNFISWVENPGINKNRWYFNNEADAQKKANELKNNINCYYLITWTIYRQNNIEGDICNFVFNDKKSVFSYFVDFL